MGEEWKAMMEKLDEKTRMWYFATEKEVKDEADSSTFDCL